MKPILSLIIATLLLAFAGCVQVSVTGLHASGKLGCKKVTVAPGIPAINEPAPRKATEFESFPLQHLLDI